MRFTSIFTLLISAASLATASTIGFTCTPSNNNSVANGVLVTGGTTAVSCGGFAAPNGSAITNVAFDFLGTYQDSVENGNHQLTFSGSSAFGGFGPVNTTISPTVGFAVASGGSAQLLASTPSWLFTVTTANTNGGNVLPYNASYTISGTYTYEVQGGGVPEPSTIALVGGVLVLAGVRKFKS